VVVVVAAALGLLVAAARAHALGSPLAAAVAAAAAVEREALEAARGIHLPELLLVALLAPQISWAVARAVAVAPVLRVNLTEALVATPAAVVVAAARMDNWGALALAAK